MSKKVFLLLKRYSCKGFYAGSWIMNKVMNCSCCLLFCQSADWRESRLDPPTPPFTICLRSLEGSQKTANWAWNRVWWGRGKVSQKSLKWAWCAHTDAVDVKHRPEYTRHSQNSGPPFWRERRATNSSWGTALAEMMLSRNGGAGITCHSF